MPYYIDTSAAAKLVVREAETVPLAKWLRQHEQELVSSDLLRTELLRAAKRVSPEAVLRARLVLDSFTLITLATSTYERAATLEPPDLRSLDALHLAAALELGDGLDGVVTYDDRLSSGAAALGVPAIAPN